MNVSTIRRALIGPRLWNLSGAKFKSPKNQNYSTASHEKLMRQIKARILASGPITVAQYMKEVLTNPTAGYYMGRDVFGQQGDFITSPEISQMFGEMIGVWFYSKWLKIGKPQPLQLIELGPGRGTLMSDILRTFGKLNPRADVSVHLIEISPHLTQMQREKLCGKDAQRDGASISLYGQKVNWYSSLSEVPRGFSFYLAHEFFDAMPIHKLVKTAEGWREVLIDIEPNDISKLRYVISRTRTPACAAFVDANEKRTEVEVSPESWVIVQELAARVDYDGGAALIVDYGHSGTKSDTFRAFRNHQLHDPLIEPGTADLTADVDFSALIRAARNPQFPRSYKIENSSDLQPTVTYGPVSQGEFLRRMGIDLRLKQLRAKCSEEIASSLQSGYDMLTSPEQMGEKFKFMAIFPAVLESFLKKFPPSGFEQ